MNEPHQQGPRATARVRERVRKRASAPPRSVGRAAFVAMAILAAVALGQTAVGTPGSNERPAAATTVDAPAGVRSSGLETPRLDATRGGWQGAREELPALRTATSRTYRLPDGRRQLESSTGSLNYRDELRGWEPVDRRLVPRRTIDGFTWHGDRLPYDLRLDEHGRYRFAPERDRPDEYVEVDAPMPAGATTHVNEQTGRVTIDAGRWRLRYDVHNDRIKGSFVLDGPGTPTSWRIPIRTGGGLRVQPDLTVTNAAGATVAVGTHPFLVDAAGTVRDLDWRVDQHDGALVMHADVRGLAYPIVVDPTFTRSATAANDGQVNATTIVPYSSCTSIDLGSTYMRLGYDIGANETLNPAMRFTNITVPRGAIVTEGRFDTVLSGHDTGVTFYSSMYVDSDGDSAALGDCTNLRQRTWKSATGTVNYVGPIGGAPHYIDSPTGIAAAIDHWGWSSGNALTGLRRSPTGAETFYWEYATTEHATYTEPRLTITYALDTTPPAPPTSVTLPATTNSTSMLSPSFSGATDNNKVTRYEHCVTQSSTGADCATTAHRTWVSDGRTGSWPIQGLAMPDGTQWYVCVRSMDPTGNVSLTHTCSGATTIDAWDFLVSSFGTDGMSGTLGANAYTDELWHGSNIAKAPDGSIYRGGAYLQPVANPQGEVPKFGFAKLTPGGMLDTSFGTNGYVYDFAAKGTSVAVQSDGKVIAAGYTLECPIMWCSEYTAYDSLVRRYLPDGTVDTTFGVGGSRVTNLPGFRFLAVGIVVDDADRIIVAGLREEIATGTYRLLMYRLTANGNLDTTFGTSGYTLHPDAMIATHEYRPLKILIDPSDRILVAASIRTGATNDMSLLRLLPDGGFDGSFGSGGVFRYDGGIHERAVAVGEHPGGGYVLYGDEDATSQWYGDRQLYVRVSGTGTLVPGWGSAGRTTVEVSPTWAWNEATDMIVLPDGSAIGTGLTDQSSSSQVGVAKLTPTGQLDTAFAGDGKLEFRPASYSFGDGLLFEPEGRFLLATGSNIGLGEVMQLPIEPSPPAALQQFEDDGTTAIATDAWSASGIANDVVLRFTASHVGNGQTLTPWVEVQPEGSPFAGTCGVAGSGMHSGSPVAAPTSMVDADLEVRVTGLSASTRYLWRACSVNADGAASAWTSRGGSPGDFRVSPVTVGTPSPASAPQGRTGLVVQVIGSGFQAGATVQFSGTGITVTNTSYVNAGRIDVTIDVDAAAATTARTVTVLNPDLTWGAGPSAFSIAVPSITIGQSVLGHSATARDASAPYSLDFGDLLPSDVRTIGPTGSGQTLSGAAIELSITSNTDTIVQVSAADFSDGASGTVPASQLAWKHFGVSEPWTPLTNAPATVEGPFGPGSPTFSYDLQLTVPSAQSPGSYSTNLTWSVVAAP